MNFNAKIASFLEINGGKDFPLDELLLEDSYYHFHYLYGLKEIIEYTNQYSSFLMPNEIIFSGNGCGDEYVVEQDTFRVFLMEHEYEFRKIPVHKDFFCLMKLLGLGV